MNRVVSNLGELNRVALGNRVVVVVDVELMLKPVGVVVVAEIGMGVD